MRRPATMALIRIVTKQLSAVFSNGFGRMKSKQCILILLAVFLIVTNLIVYQHLVSRAALSHAQLGDSHAFAMFARRVNWSTWKSALTDTADNNRVIFLAQVDEGFLDMAFNLYETSLKPHNILNFLFVGLTYPTCGKLLHAGLRCYVYREMSTGEEASRFGSPDYIAKMNMRTEMIVEALSFNFTVLHTDLDLVFMKSPLPHIHCDDDCHLATMMDKDIYNPGFIFIRPTKYSIFLYTYMKFLAVNNTYMNDQEQLNRAITDMSQRIDNFYPKKLNVTFFQSGLMFFENENRTFADDSTALCKQCIVMHNNWIVSYDAKVYRFKEMLLWQYDGENQYYSSTDRKYLTYDNLNLGRGNSKSGTLILQERAVLRSALAIAEILNRTLILPKFHCNNDEPRTYTLCALHHIMNVQEFNSFFDYREHSFLLHPKVPNIYKTKEGQSHVMVNKAMMSCVAGKEIEAADLIHFPDDIENGASPGEILNWYGNNTDHVLHFTTLYGAFRGFDSVLEQDFFNKRSSAGMHKGSHRQFNEQVPGKTIPFKVAHCTK